MTDSVSVLCGQLLVVGLSGTDLTAEERARFARGERGGVVLFRRNVAGGPEGVFGVSRLLADVQAAMPADLPALTAVDQEGGRVMRLGPPVMQLPPMRRLGDLDDVVLVREVAEAHARELRAIGFTLSFAPVADVHTRADNPIIGDRAFATTPEGVVRHGLAWAEGLARGGIQSCAKHFPGHGDTTVDSHLALPRVERPRLELDRVEIAPFAAMARSPFIDAMMTAHVVYPALDPDVPATLSPSVCTQLLREELGFEGVLFSDDLEMKAIQLEPGDAAVQAILAGCDVLLVCSRADMAEVVHAALVKEVERSSAFRARCREASERALAMRRRAGRPELRSAAALEAAFAKSASVRQQLAERLAAGGAS